MSTPIAKRFIWDKDTQEYLIKIAGIEAVNLQRKLQPEAVEKTMALINDFPGETREMFLTLTAMWTGQHPETIIHYLDYLRRHMEQVAGSEKVSVTPS